MSDTAALATPAPPNRSARIFSGIQPSGGLTLGNYLGALKRFVQKQDEGIQTIYCLVDMHAITVWQDPQKLRHATREAAAGLLPQGLIPRNQFYLTKAKSQLMSNWVGFSTVWLAWAGCHA